MKREEVQTALKISSATLTRALGELREGQAFSDRTGRKCDQLPEVRCGDICPQILVATNNKGALWSISYPRPRSTKDDVWAAHPNTL